jgi:hypothetical protein
MTSSGSARSAKAVKPRRSHDDDLAAMAFEDAFVALCNDQVGQLRREETAKFAGALDLGELRRDPRLLVERLASNIALRESG